MTKSAFAKEHLKSFIDRIERMETEKAALVADIGEIYKEARGMGFDTKIIRKVVALRKLDTADFQEQMAVLDLYLGAVGMGGTPLGDYATRAPAKAKTPAASRAAPHALFDSETGEIIESHAKADADAPAKANTQSAVGEESVSRGADARSSAATSELMDETGGERPAPTKSSDDIPAFLDRRPAHKRTPALATA